MKKIELLVYCTNLKSLPNRSSLKKMMWSEAKSISHSFDLKEFGSLTLSWDKWIDDERWSKDAKKPFEHINFEVIDSNIVLIDIEDDALFIDKRAFYKGAIYICEKTNGKISEDKITWKTPKEISHSVDNYINCSFKEAVELSYKEAII